MVINREFDNIGIFMEIALWIPLVILSIATENGSIQIGDFA